MYKLLLDSDALIKISKIGLLEMVSKEFEVLITEDIYEEAVQEGKKRFYEDANKIESLVNNGKIKILKRTHYIKSKKPKQNFGRGELSVYQAYKKDKIILTDDLSFTSYIKKEGIKSISSANIIIILTKKGRLNKSEAYDSLEKLRPLIRKELYELVKEEIENA